MGFRFRRSVKLFPGLRLNASKSGLSMSVGTRGAWYTVGPKGRRRVTVGLPGTGISYTTTSSKTAEGGKPREGAPRISNVWINLLWIVAITVFWVWIFSKGPAAYSH